MNIDLSNVNQTRKSDIRHAIWDIRSASECLREISIPIDKNAKGEFKSIDNNLQGYMPIFALFKSDRPNIDQDPEAQDPLKLAVKEIIKARQSDLNAIASTIRSELQRIADKTVEKIQEMDPEIAKQLSPNIGDPAWDRVFKISLTSEEEVPVNKRGSGFRRLVLLNFFRVKAEEQASGKDVIYAIEEPETSQHPNNQKMLINAFENLAYRGNCQVFATTHTPMLASFVSDNNLRYIKIDNGKRKIVNRLSDEDKKEIANSLGVLPDSKVKLFLFIEGKNDIEFLKGIAHLFSIDLAEAENKGELIFVPMGGSNLQLWVSRLAGLNKREIYIYDGDNKPNMPDDENTGNKTIFQTSKRELENYIHLEAITKIYEEQYITIEIATDEIQNDTDVPLLIAEKVHNASTSCRNWYDFDETDKDKKQGRVKKLLNTAAVKKMTEEQLKQIGGWDEIQRWMEAIKVSLNDHEKN